MQVKKITIVSLLALLIAIIAPLWASLTTYAGLLTAPVALISAGLYVANGSKLKNALKITLGFLAGNIWAYLVVITMEAVGGAIAIHPLVLLFITLAVFIIVAVFIASYLDMVFDLASWLSGWAVTLTILNLGIPAPKETMLLHIGIAMVGGVWLVGVLIISCHSFLVKKLSPPQDKGEDA